MDHRLMFLVLTYLAEVDSAESREVAEKLKIKPKHASVLLSRCSRRKLVSRKPYKRGREHGYVYTLNENGANWILHKASKWKTDVPAPSKPVTKAIPKRPIIILRQPIQPMSRDSDYEMLRDLASAYAIIKHTKQVSLKTRLPAASPLLMKKHEEDISYMAYKLHDEQKKRQKNEYLLKETLKSNQELIRMCLHFYMAAQKFEPTRHLRFGCSFGKLEMAAEQLASTKIASMLQERLASKWDAGERSHNIASVCNAMDHWWNTLPSTSGGSFENILEKVPRVKTSRPQNQQEPQNSRLWLSPCNHFF